MTDSNVVLDEIAQVFHFEFWLRYYFIQERDDQLYIHLTAQQSKQMQAQFSDYWPLVQDMQDQPLSPELSQRILVEFIEFHLAGKKIPAGLVPTILDDKKFSIEMLLFNTWVDVHEEQLMQKIYGFDYWLNAYEEWKKSDQATQLRQSYTLQLQDEKKTFN